MTIDCESLRPAFERWAIREGKAWRDQHGIWFYGSGEGPVLFEGWCAAFESLGEPVAWLRDDELRKLGRPYSDAPLNAKTDSMLIHAKGTSESAAKFGHGVPVYRLPEVKP